MVARRSGEIPVLIFDLDGTILAVNSFPHWAAYVARGCFPHLGLGRRARIASAAIALLGLRKLGLCDHETLKRRLQHLWQSATLDDGGACELNFIGGLSRHVRPELKPILAAVAAGKVDAVLATAAAADYADALGRSLGFADVLATPRSRRPSEPSNRGEHKRDSVMTLLRARLAGPAARRLHRSRRRFAAHPPLPNPLLVRHDARPRGDRGNAAGAAGFRRLAAR